MEFSEIFDFDRTIAARLFSTVDYPWEALDMLPEYIRRVGRLLDKDKFREPRPGVWISRSAEVADGAKLTSPLIIGERSRIESTAYLRGGVIIGRDCVVGDSAEIKNSVLFDGAVAPHCNYVGDSLIGHRAQLGAGAVISNLRADRGEVICFLGSERVNSGRKRLGALIGDFAEIGCSSIISPGTVICRNARVEPLTRASGFVARGQSFRGERLVSDIL